MKAAQKVEFSQHFLIGCYLYLDPAFKWRGFKFVQMKGDTKFRGDNNEIVKKPWQNLKIFSRTTRTISTKPGTKHPLGNK